MNYFVFLIISVLILLSACTSGNYYEDFDFTGLTEACPVKDYKDDQSVMMAKICGVEMHRNCNNTYMLDYGDDSSPTWLHVVKKEGDICVYSLYHKGKLSTQQCWNIGNANKYIECP